MTKIGILIKKYFPDIRFWIVFFFIIRLYGIWFPPIDAAHSWRQVTGNMVARNFLETDANIFYPRVDMAGEKTGITGTEFPVLNYLIFLMAKIFGWQEWYGRLIVLLFSSLGVSFFYRIIKLKFPEKTALYASLILLASNWFIYSRKIMPDTFSVSLVMIGLWYALRYFEKQNAKHLIFSSLLILLGVLSKIPAILILCPLLLIFWSKSYKIESKIWFSMMMLPVMGIVFWWYYLWVPHLVETYGYWHYYMGTSWRQGFAELQEYLPEVLNKFYFDALKFSGFTAFLAGFILLVFKPKQPNKKLLFHLLLWSSVLFFVFMLKSGRNFAVHSYYIVPFVPIMALIAGYAISQIKYKNLAILAISIIALEGVANQQHDFRMPKEKQHMLEYSEVLDLVSQKSDLILVNGGANPTDLYFTHRNGWSMENAEIKNTETRDSLYSLGCRWVLINKHYENYPTFALETMVFSNSDFEVIHLKTEL
ncbi:MAG: glycosyltransferase family 39 protein [Bacteroidales bacterium]|nr:glycosyltransferase family 39 protein [Bacteroidales bacterium]